MCVLGRKKISRGSGSTRPSTTGVAAVVRKERKEPNKQAGRAGACNTERAPDQVARLRCNDGCKRSYLFLICSATHLALIFSGSATTCASFRISSLGDSRS